MIFNKLQIVLCSIFLLVGCEQNRDYQYLLTHPGALKKEVERCDQLAESPIASLSVSDKKHCELVMYTAANMISVLNEQQDDPQKFGQKVMAAQFHIEETKELIGSIKQTLDQMLAAKSNPDKLKLIEKQLADAQDSYQKQTEEMKLFLAVLSMSSPE
jgi:hypothetical protein